VIRKGRPVSNSGRDAGGPRDGDSLADFHSPDGSADSTERFDPFESFDAHDRTAGRGPVARSASGAPISSASNSSASNSSAPTYTRSRRTLDGSPKGERKETSSQRPVRSLKGRALAFLSRREYSRAELSRKLLPFTDEADSLETLLDSLESEGWLSDSRFAESLIHRRASRMGTSRIVGELKRHAVGQTLIEEVGAQLRDTELARAPAVWRKKYGQLPETPAERAKQARFLAARGFSQSVIGKILKGIDEDWSPE
jgi:regulatory protein